MYKKHNTRHIFVFFCVLFALTAANSLFAATATDFSIDQADASIDHETLSLLLMGKSTPVYTVTERFSPFRVVIDIANATFSGDITPDKILPKNKFVTLKVTDHRAGNTAATRLEFTLDNSHNYRVINRPNGLKITFAPIKNELAKELTRITAFQVITASKTTTIKIVANNKITDYQVDTLKKSAGKPPRMYIDINEVDISQLIRTKEIGTSVATVQAVPRGNGVRIIFDSSSETLFHYSIQSSLEGLNVIINENSQPHQQSTDNTLKSLIDSSERLANSAGVSLQNGKSPTKPNKLQSVFAGYDRERISVDFFKIDLHNVFRLLREVSGQNIIVDESVTGSLTLALKDVPWDFALDIILNLKDLEKEERFNTIVIYAKNKAFVWPNQSVGSLTIEESPEIIAHEELIIEQAAQQPKEILQAKEFLAQARKAEKKEQFEIAVELYNQALNLWPENTQIASRIATIYLVDLGMNAKALYYAQKALAINASDSRAALYAAISSANMGRVTQASEFFRQSISGTPPAQEALASFAAFSENNNNNRAALILLKKLQEEYGETLDNMIAIGRIYDKQGQYQKANKQYNAILNSGFQLRPSLKKYITERLQAQLN
ncbi:secretin and TonB N-terminal domain-containing protein [Desulfotalea psychrophila]|uniref:Related to fimbrial assembly protein PilQ [Precursor] n=1 Tax=Desulfotalea psychrophila (strain LSv54 / DSM 12343) TaxID=177439 RepID=Q6AS34_DESPS|nr:secretin and TonB N-terminal domain-containing protein [Desulfotalea psychrophila]CAG34841.1 related to fimbrial assembly protein PilQ [Precursor] [Desulfotalea psychrophila LSv54]